MPYDRETPQERIHRLESELKDLKRALGTPPTPPAPAPEPAAEPSSGRGMSLMGLSGSLLIFGLMIAVPLLIWAYATEKLEGSGRASGLVLGGTWGGDVEDCASGEAYTPEFFGVDVFISGHRVRALPGKRLERKLLVFVSGKDQDSVTFLGANECPTLDIEMEWSGTEINDVDAIDGSIDAECALPDGSTLALHTKFSNCH